MLARIVTIWWYCLYREVSGFEFTVHFRRMDSDDTDSSLVTLHCFKFSLNIVYKRKEKDTLF